MPNSAGILRGLLTAALFVTAAPCWAQAVRFPSGSAAANTVLQPGVGAAQPGVSGGLQAVPPPTAPFNGVTAPGYTTPGYATPGYTAPGGVPANSAPALLQQPPFDPFSTTQGAATQASPALGFPQSPSGLPPTTGFGPPTQPLYAPPGGQAFPQQPGALYPNGYPNVMPQNPLGQGWFGQQGGAQPGPYLKLLEDFRVVHTWVYGDRGDEMNTNDIEAATTINIPNFVYSGYPISITPAFVFHFWNGPSPPILVDLPPRAYSTFATFDWNPMASPRFGGEFSGTIGVFSDFGAVNHDSIRLIGKTLFVYHVTPKFTIKGGIEYLDRVRIKLLPAGGFVWTPNDRVRFDVYFPKPKLAQYLITIGTTEVWWYVSGEYGYGSWTLEYPTGSVRTDINDLRVIGGLEWVNNASTLKGFFEMGYVFDREVVFAEMPASNFTLKDSFMLRSGIAF
ncbi:MAG: hypothetical protein RIC55_10000 [Pirellulaceae bacterium]